MKLYESSIEICRGQRLDYINKQVDHKPIEEDYLEVVEDGDKTIYMQDEEFTVVSNEAITDLELWKLLEKHW